jgi:hypothetical protein
MRPSLVVSLLLFSFLLQGSQGIYAKNISRVKLRDLILLCMSLGLNMCCYLICAGIRLEKGFMQVGAQEVQVGAQFFTHCMMH